MTIKQLLTYYPDLKPQTKETFLSGIKFGIYIGLAIATLVYFIMSKLV